jgi:hypothetical protein
VRTAHGAGESWGWAVITHPFHPRRGERFRVLKTRRYGGQATLILEGGEGGTFSILEEWTDQAAPTGAGAARLLSAPALLELVQLVRQWKASAAPAARQGKGVDRCP